MMKQLLRGTGTLALVLLSAFGLAACGNNSADLDPAEAVNIRFSNDTGSKIERLWLGNGPEGNPPSTFDTRYTNIDDGDLSDYQTIEPIIANYNFANFTIDGERYSARGLNPHEALGVEGLSPGSYYTLTLVLGAEDNALLSDITVDEQP